MQRTIKTALPLVAVGLLSGCLDTLDMDMRGITGGFDTSDAALKAQVAKRPEPDARGVISYSDYDVAIARRGDTLADVAGRVGMTSGELASQNGIAPDAILSGGEVIALPRRAGGGNVIPTAGTALTPQVVDVTELASTAIDRAPDDAPIAGQAGPAPLRHRVEDGETAFTIARLYNIPVQSLAEWNGLGSDLAVRTGQLLLIPLKVETAAGPSPVAQPGTGSATPTPPSSTRPQPRSDVTPDQASAVAAAGTAATAVAPKPVADLKPATTASASQARLIRPVSGSIIRDYKKGRNDGIDIGAAAGTAVKAADKGTVAAITEDTNGVKILVVKHSGNLFTIYTNIDSISVAKGDSVSRGQSIAKVKAGTPPFLHFEVRKGLDAVDPNDYI